MSFIRKAWAVANCKNCGKPTKPWQSKERHWAGSRLWYQGIHFECALQIHYGEAVRKQIEASAPSIWLSIVKPKREFSGGKCRLPIRFK